MRMKEIEAARRPLLEASALPGWCYAGARFFAAEMAGIHRRNWLFAGREEEWEGPGAYRVVDTVGLRDRLDHRPSELSGGQQQRVACARALASRPDVVFADEPTGNLDSRSSGEVLAFLRASVDEMGQTIIIVTHDPAAAAYADRALFLADGRIVDEMADPTAERVLDQMKSFDVAAPQKQG